MESLKQSEIISAFLKLVEKVRKEYEAARDMVNYMDKELTDIVHKAELEHLKQHEKARLMTELQKNRKERRYWKNKVDEYQPLYELFSTSKEFKPTVEQLKQVLGKVRKAENYLQYRKYKPRVRLGDKSDG